MNTKGFHMTCSTCHFFTDSNGFMGNCRRYPPTVPHNEFPRVQRDIWCGEYRASEPSTASGGKAITKPVLKI